MGSNHMDFDTFRHRDKHSCTLFGKVYPALPQVSFDLGLELMGLEHLTWPDQLVLMDKTINFSFGKGTFTKWRRREDFTQELCRAIMTYIRSGYSESAVFAMRELIEKNDSRLVELMTEMIRSSTSASTGELSTPILPESTISDSPSLEA